MLLSSDIVARLSLGGYSTSLLHLTRELHIPAAGHPSLEEEPQYLRTH